MNSAQFTDLLQNPCFEPARSLIQCIQTQVERQQYPLRRSRWVPMSVFRESCHHVLQLGEDAQGNKKYPRTVTSISADVTPFYELPGQPWYAVIPELWGLIPPQCQVWYCSDTWTRCYRSWITKHVTDNQRAWLCAGFESAWDIISSCLAYREHEKIAAAKALEPLAWLALEGNIPLRVADHRNVVILSE